MKIRIIYLFILIGGIVLAFAAKKTKASQVCWCWSEDQGMVAAPIVHRESKEYLSYGSYGVEPDWNDPQHILPLNYEQAQGKRIFYQQCVWCHADSTPAGPSNRTNVTPTPALMNDGATLNKMDDKAIVRIIATGGGGVGRSAMMPPYGETLSKDDIHNLLAYIRVIATPTYPGLAGSGSSAPVDQKK
uniref:Cytochrome c domain-containing protein n=1 Tax=mine drainage metagenome TaxID=410659 RepID=E6PZZ8_9ZZZZ